MLANGAWNFIYSGWLDCMLFDINYNNHHSSWFSFLLVNNISNNKTRLLMHKTFDKGSSVKFPASCGTSSTILYAIILMSSFRKKNIFCYFNFFTFRNFIFRDTNRIRYTNLNVFFIYFFALISFSFPQLKQNQTDTISISG